MDEAAIKALFAQPPQAGSITELGLNTYRQGLPPQVVAPTPMPFDRATAGPIEKLGMDTYGRELRRSPADGTFRTKNEMVNNWDAFRQPRNSETVKDAMARALLGTGRDSSAVGAMPGTRLTDLW
jgi:hypothetical protein